MITVERIAKNITVLMLSQVATSLLAFFYMMYTARYLGSASFGVLSFALAFVTIFSVFTDLGLQRLIVRELARDKSLAAKYLANVSLTKIILVVITFGLIALTINVLGYPGETIAVVYIVGLSAVFMAFNQMFYGIFQAFEKMEYQSLGQVLNAALLFGGVMLAIKQGFTVAGFASLYFMANVIVLGYNLTIVKLKSFRPADAASKVLEFDWSFIKPMLKQALPFGLTGMFIMIYYYIDSVMLSLMKGNEVVGWYNAAYRLVLVPLFIPSIFNAAIFPVMSRFSISSKVSLEFTYQRYFKYMVMLSIPIGVGTTLLADRFILVVFGGEYAPAIIALQILIWSSVFIFMNGVFGRLIESLNKQIIATKLAVIGAAVNVVLNLLFIPRYGYIAASATTVVTEFIILVLAVIVTFKLGYGISLAKIARDVGKAMVASVVMGFFVWYFAGLNLIILVALAAVIYFVLMWALRFFDREDINIARQLATRLVKSKSV